MKKIINILVLMALCFPFSFSGERSDYYSKSYARLSYVNGDVFLQRAGDLGYDEGVVNLPIVEGDKLGTREGRSEVHLGRGNYLRINSDTQIDFSKLPERGNDRIQISLLEGNIYIRISEVFEDKGIEIHTPDASFYALDVGLYYLGVNSDGKTELSVFEGEIEAAGEEGSIAVKRGDCLIAENGYFHEGNELYSGSRNDFAEWNRSRESFHNRKVYRRYLPEELGAYEAELDYYGRWTYESSLGYVWVPKVRYSSWRPYNNGRWSWYPNAGWTWVSYEPWGWCVSHYGRWHWGVNLGWHWIPTSHWGPAWVNWHHGRDYIAWTPLSYWNRPVVVLNNRFYGRYYNNDYPYNSRAMTMVRKNQLQARHISKVALGRNGLKRAGKISMSSRQPSIKHKANMNRGVSQKASKVLMRKSSRSVSKNFNASKALRSRVGSKRSGNSISKSTLPKNRLKNSSRSKITPSERMTGSQKSTLKRNNVRNSNITRSLKGRTSLKSSSSSRSNSRVKKYSSQRSSRSGLKKSPSSSLNRSSKKTASRSKTSSKKQVVKKKKQVTKPRSFFPKK